MKLRTKNKTFFVVALAAVMAISTIASVIPMTGAHSPPWTIPTFAYCTASPVPVGVGQQVLIVMWLDKTNPLTFNFQYGEFWTGYKLDITKPDGTIETLGPFTAEATGSTYTLYSPTQVGTYKIVFSFPGQTIKGTNLWPGFNLPGYGPLYSSQAGRDPLYINDTFSASTSKPFYLTVQDKPVAAWPASPVPTGYWERPINAMNRDWVKISSNYFSGASVIVGPCDNFAYGRGPESAHVLWVRPYESGGLVGGENYAGLPLTGNRMDLNWMQPPIIINGKLYYNNDRVRPFNGWYCVDLYTGETLYFKNATTTSTFKTSPVLGVQSGSTTTTGLLAFGSVQAFYHPDESTNTPYLYVTNTGISGQWDVLDAFTGERVYSIGNVSTSGTQVYGSSGDIDYYRIANLGNSTNPQYYLTLWNSTLSTSRYQQSVWYPEFPNNMGGQIWDGNNGWQLNVSIPAVQGSILAIRERQFVIGGTKGYNYPGSPSNIDGNLWALSLKPGEEGKLLWNKTFTPPANLDDVSKYAATGPYNPGIAGWTAVGTGGSFIASSFFVDPEDGVFTFASPLNAERWGYDLATMQQIWKTEPESPWQFFGIYTTFYDGKVIGTGYGGQVIGYDAKTGTQLWNYNVTSPTPEDSPYGWNRNPIFPPLCADGKLYLFESEHSPTFPLERGRYVHCLDVDTGKLLWKLAFYGSSYVASARATLSMADGYLIGVNNYDRQIYCIGVGPSETTVSTPDVAVQQGTPVLIKGTVTDQSPGAKGTPAISDQDMQAWMEYKYEQQVYPANAKGVSVHLTVIDPNNNYQDIGNATSNIGGTYGISWTPPVPGLYTVTATFEGSNSYGSSSATTTFYVSSPAQPIVTSTPTTAPTGAPTTTPVKTASASPSPAVEPPTSGMPTATYIAIGVAVIVVVATAAALILRKRK